MRGPITAVERAEFLGVEDGAVDRPSNQPSGASAGDVGNFLTGLVEDIGSQRVLFSTGVVSKLVVRRLLHLDRPSGGHSEGNVAVRERQGAIPVVGREARG
ncbi:hypothetical protein [Paenarthrobacter sp. TE4293]|uniref:hypothetical protein n=1 Tax=Paenarthrobacter sp. TE4293 TaxID=3381695 RepID=UPI003D1C30F9